MQKKTGSKRGAAVRDITVKKAKEDDGFQVHSIQKEEDLPSVEPLEDQTVAEMDDELMNAVAQIQDVPAPFSVDRSAPLSVDRSAPLSVDRSAPFSVDRSAPLSVDRSAPATPAIEQREPEIPEDPEPRDFVKVKFAKFVQLVSARDCREVAKQNNDEDVVISSNLLTELASAHDGREERKMPVVFLVGLAIGVVLTYILYTK